jgi:hypothetical protein
VQAVGRVRRALRHRKDRNLLPVLDLIERIAMECGLLVRISSRSGVEHPLYAVAVEGAEQAIEVLKKAGIGDGDEFAIIAPLSAQVLAKLGLGPGQFKCLNPIGRDTRRRRDSSRFGARRLRPPPDNCAGSP